MELEEKIRTNLSGVKVRIWSKQCQKWRYLDEDTAWADIEDQKEKRRKRKNRGRPVPHAVYLCRGCEGYHMTHAKQNQGWKPKKRKRVKK